MTSLEGEFHRAMRPWKAERRPDLVRYLSERGLVDHAPFWKLAQTLFEVLPRDETADVCRDKDGNPEPDPELRDTEKVPLKEDIHEYFAREVLPHVPDAWIDEGKTKVGYEIPFTGTSTPTRRRGRWRRSRRTSRRSSRRF